MSEVSIIGLDIAKNVFQAHGADGSGRALFSRKISRAKLLEFFADSSVAQSRWKRVGARTIGAGSSRGWGTR